MLTTEQRHRIIDQDTGTLLERVESIAFQLELLGNEAAQGYFDDDNTKAERNAAARALAALASQAGRVAEGLNRTFKVG